MFAYDSNNLFLSLVLIINYGANKIKYLYQTKIENLLLIEKKKY